jgi:diacylglycerol kinase (ATP)
MKVLPNAVMNDGLLDVCIVEALSKPAFLRAFPRVFVGSHTTHPKVRMWTGTRVQVEADRRVLVYADGELVGSLPAIFEVRPAALPVVVGPDAKGVR